MPPPESNQWECNNNNELVDPIGIFIPIDSTLVKYFRTGHIDNGLGNFRTHAY